MICHEISFLRETVKLKKIKPCFLTKKAKFLRQQIDLAIQVFLMIPLLILYAKHKKFP